MKTPLNQKSPTSANGQGLNDNNKDTKKQTVIQTNDEFFTQLKVENKKENTFFLNIILETQRRLRNSKETEITFSAPIMWQNEKPAIYPNTINVIQGQAGSHKSRLAEMMCSALLKWHC